VSAAEPAARVSSPVKESDLATITLSKDAEARLGIRSAPVESRAMPEVRRRAGFVVVPPGRSITVQAPLAGRLAAVEGAPEVGAGVERGQAILRLEPLLGPDATAALESQRAAATGDARVAESDFAAAARALERAEELLEQRAGSQRAVDEARAAWEGARARRETAEERARLLARAAEGTLEAFALAAPIDGVLRAVHGAPGQTVPAGAPLFGVEDASRPWVRVPIYAGEAARVDAAAPARAPDRLGDAELAPIAAPPSADAAAATVDLWYAVAAEGVGLRPGESLLVELPLVASGPRATVPAASVVRDAQGGAWVYESLPDGRYARRRVDVERVEDGVAVLARGPEPGVQVVVEGAAELFGTEFFVSK